MERTETRLLTAFHQWAGPVGQTIRSHREALRALDLQIEEIGGRVAKLKAAQGWPHSHKKRYALTPENGFISASEQ